MTTVRPSSCSFFFFNDTATTEIYTLSLHDALPICNGEHVGERQLWWHGVEARSRHTPLDQNPDQGLHLNHGRSEEHTSELQSQSNLVCRLLLEKKKNSQENVWYMDEESFERHPAGR